MYSDSVSLYRRVRLLTTPSNFVSQLWWWPSRPSNFTEMASPSPYRTILSCSGVSSRTGCLTLKPCRRPTPSSCRKYQPEIAAERVQGTIAPSAMLRFLFGITRSASISILTPRPVQSGQAPWGLLKEKLRGASSPKEIWSKGHHRCSEYRRSSSPSMSSLRTPPPSFSAVSTDSAMREVEVAVLTSPPSPSPCEERGLETASSSEG